MSLHFDNLVESACEWAFRCEQIALKEGGALDGCLQSVAIRIGVEYPKAVRVLQVERIPAPHDPILKLELTRLNVLKPRTGAMTFGYGIMVCRGAAEDYRLMVRELGRVGQYERHKTMERFIKQYLWELNCVGQGCSPMEMEVRILEELFGNTRNLTLMRKGN